MTTEWLKTYNNYFRRLNKFLVTDVNLNIMKYINTRQYHTLFFVGTSNKLYNNSHVLFTSTEKKDVYKYLRKFMHVSDLKEYEYEDRDNIHVIKINNWEIEIYFNKKESTVNFFCCEKTNIEEVKKFFDKHKFELLKKAKEYSKYTEFVFNYDENNIGEVEYKKISDTINIFIKILNLKIKYDDFKEMQSIFSGQDNAVELYKFPQDLNYKKIFEKNEMENLWDMFYGNGNFFAIVKTKGPPNIAEITSKIKSNIY